jgi:hypothetical protein
MAPRTFRDTVPGLRLGERVERAAATLPQSTAAAIFNVKGGRVLVTLILGQVTTAIQNQANNTKLVANPTTGTDVDMCAVVDTANLEVGAKLAPVGTLATALGKATAGAIAAQATPIIVDPGTIDLNCASSNTGAVKWTLFYMPLDSGAYVEAA